MLAAGLQRRLVGIVRIEQVQRILVLGAGRVGCEVAVQCAVHGYCTSVYDVDAEQLRSAAGRQKALLQPLVREGRIGAGEAEAALARIRTIGDPEVAAAGVDLVSESAPERLPTKREVFRQFDELCPARAIFTTNSSYHLPSAMARFSGRPAQFAALHFHVPVWDTGVVDIMPHPGTSADTVRLLADFARRIGQLPIVLKKENHGYVFNAMLRPLLMSALTLAQQEVASVEDIDRSWMAVTKMGIGPFGMLDSIGLDTVHEIASYWSLVLRDPQAGRNAEYLRGLLSEGKKGLKTQQGFYRYPQPAFSQPGFLGAPDGAFGRAPGSRELQRSTAAAAGKQRMVLRMAAAPVCDTIRHVPKLYGPVWILGDPAVAEAVGRRVREMGSQVVALPACGSEAEGEKELDAAIRQGLAPHLFVALGQRGSGGGGADRYHRNVWWPYWVCRRWYLQLVQTGTLGRGTLVAATGLGGDFGISGRIDCVEGGGLAGLAKAVFMEAAAEGALGPQVKVVDLPAETSAAAAAERLLYEMGLAQASVVTGTREEMRRRFADLEVGYAGGVRRAVRVVPEELGELPPPSLARGSVWLITGGARGICAEVARQLGVRFGLRLHLLGRSPLPQEDWTRLSETDVAALKREVMSRAYRQRQKPNEAWERVARGMEIQRSLAALAAAGVTATYHAGDVSDRHQLRTILENVRSRDGGIQGIIHGAGVEATCRFAKKQPSLVDATLGTKYRGAAALMELTRDDPLEYFVAFGSLAGRFGGIGQTDYAMANDLLAKQMAGYRVERPGCVVFTVHWPGWDEVGMAVRPASRAALERTAHRLMPVAEGVAHLLREMAAGGPAAEVVIADRAELPPELLAGAESPPAGRGRASRGNTFSNRDAS